MTKTELENLLKGELVKIKNKNNEIIGAIQIDFDCNMFLALTGDGINHITNKEDESSFLAMDLWDNLEETMKQVEYLAE